jgi:hypothetical protein
VNSPIRWSPSSTSRRARSIRRSTATPSRPSTAPSRAASDQPQEVARQIVAALRGGHGEHHFGFPGTSLRLAQRRRPSADRPRPRRQAGDRHQTTQPFFLTSLQGPRPMKILLPTARMLALPIFFAFSQLAAAARPAKNSSGRSRTNGPRSSTVSPRNSRPTAIARWRQQAHQTRRSPPRPARALIWEGIVVSSEAGAERRPRRAVARQGGAAAARPGAEDQRPGAQRFGLHQPRDALRQGARLADRLW